jgi:SAM-dependent methyltransferase
MLFPAAFNSILVMTKFVYEIGPRQRERIGDWLKKPLAYKFRSLAVKTYRAIVRIDDFMFEKRHRLNCGGYIEPKYLANIGPAALPHAGSYEGVRCAHAKELIDAARKTGIVFDNFVDLGSGKGKACFYAAKKYRFKQIIGVELSDELVDVANANRIRFGVDHISFLKRDAALFVLPEGNNLVFLFNPFDEVILQEFLQNNMHRFRQSQSVIAYANDRGRLCLARHGFATLFRNQDSRGSLHQYMADAGSARPAPGPSSG